MDADGTLHRYAERREEERLRPLQYSPDIRHGLTPAFVNTDGFVTVDASKVFSRMPCGPYHRFPAA